MQQEWVRKKKRMLGQEERVLEEFQATNSEQNGEHVAIKQLELQPR